MKGSDYREYVLNYFLYENFEILRVVRPYLNRPLVGAFPSAKCPFTDNIMFR